MPWRSEYKKYGMNLNEDDIIITAGVSEALLNLNSALLDKSDSPLTLRPYYPQYVMRMREEEGVPIIGRMMFWITIGQLTLTGCANLSK